MKPLLTRALFILLFSFLGFGNLYAQQYKDQLTIESDNDQYVNPNHDRYYTDGTILTFTHAMHHTDTGNLVKKIMEYQLGQQLYNPSTAHIYKPSLFDRPFTGYLFGSVAINWLYADESAFKLTAQLGSIGPNSLGEPIQTAFHKLFKLYPVGPWYEYGIQKSELGLNLNLDYKKLLYRNDAGWFDVSMDPDAQLGNTFTYVDAGMQLRLGNLGKFFDSEITNSHVGNIDKGPQKHEFYIFAEPQFSYVAYNATIEGGLFTHETGPTFGIYHIVYIQQLGLEYASSRWSASYTAFIKTREVKSTALGDQWAAINIAYRFGKI
jgi:lipid A 3-O-deacylase